MLKAKRFNKIGLLRVWRSWRWGEDKSRECLRRNKGFGGSKVRTAQGVGFEGIKGTGYNLVLVIQQGIVKHRVAGVNCLSNQSVLEESEMHTQRNPSSNEARIEEKSRE